MNQIVHTVKIWQKLLLLKQSLFGLPWIVVGGLLPFLVDEIPAQKSYPWPYMVIAFLSMRMAGMCFNRLIDHAIDARNPRTASRPLPGGEISRLQVIILSIAFLCTYLWSAFKINEPTFILSPLVIALVLAYSYTKRFTYLCHFVLGSIHCLGPVCAWIAITGYFSPISPVFGISLACSIAANDIIYACQDIDFDRKEKLYSIPAHFGEKAAILTAKTLHMLSFSMLIAFGIICGLSYIYFTGIFAMGLVFCTTYVWLKKRSIEQLFSWSNITSGMILMSTILGDIVWQG